MSNLVCKNCKSIAVDYCGGTSYYRCNTCGQRGSRDKFTLQTVFHRITQSPEVLAPYCISTKPSINGDTLYYYSTVTSCIYLTESEAIAATVERMKEVYR